MATSKILWTRFGVGCAGYSGWTRYSRLNQVQQGELCSTAEQGSIGYSSFPCSFHQRLQTYFAVIVWLTLTCSSKLIKQNLYVNTRCFKIWILPKERLMIAFFSFWRLSFSAFLTFLNVQHDSCFCVHNVAYFRCSPGYYFLKKEEYIFTKTLLKHICCCSE